MSTRRKPFAQGPVILPKRPVEEGAFLVQFWQKKPLSAREKSR